MTNAKLADASVSAAKLAAGSVMNSQLADGSVSAAKLGNDVSFVPPDGSITSLKIADGAVDTVDLKNGAVTAAKLGDSALVRGLTVTDPKMQWGRLIGGNTCTDTIVTFPQPFASAPVVLVAQDEAVGGYAHFIAYAGTTTGFRVSKPSGSVCSNYGWIVWIASGEPVAPGRRPGTRVLNGRPRPGAVTRDARRMCRKPPRPSARTPLPLVRVTRAPWLRYQGPRQLAGSIR